MKMKPFTKSFFLIFLLLFSAMPLSAQNNCSSLYAFLEKKGFQPQVQMLTASGTNNLPYNIIVYFSPKDTISDHNLVLLFDLEQGYTNRETISTIFDDLQNANFHSSVVFCYGSRLDLPRQNIIYGSKVFSQSLNSDGSNDVFIFNLDAEKNAIIPGSNKNHSPSWMIKAIFDGFSKAKMQDGLPLCYISQVADYTFTSDKTLLSFLELDIPCISANIRDSSKADIIIKSLISDYGSNLKRQNDTHTFMFRFFNKRVWFSEYIIINAILVIVVLGFLMVFILGFVNKNIRREFWQEISTIWYSLPCIYILSYCGFFIGKGLYRLFVRPDNLNYTVYGFIILQASIATLMVLLFFMLNLSLQKKYTTRSLDFLLVIDTFINLVIFTLLDISLFPIFLIIFTVAVISLIFRRNWIHIVLFVFLIIPFIPYINAIYAISDKENLHSLLISSNSLPFLLSLVLLPVYLMWLRILNSMKKRYTRKRIYAFVISGAYLFIILALIIINRIFYYEKNESSQAFTIYEAGLAEQKNEYDFSLNYSDRLVFNDIIRKLNIVSTEVPVYTSVNVISTNPILYSENDYIFESQQLAEFLLPLYPSNNLEFNYGTNDFEQTIIVEQIFYSQTENKYFSLTKTLNTGNSE